MTFSDLFIVFFLALGILSSLSVCLVKQQMQSTPKKMNEQASKRMERLAAAVVAAAAAARYERLLAAATLLLNLMEDIGSLVVFTTLDRVFAAADAAEFL